MVYRFLYVDDEYGNGKRGQASIRSIVRALTGNSIELEIIPEEPKDFQKQITRVQSSLVPTANEADKFHGLILDWRLDEGASGNDKALFRAGALAQEIRTLGTESTLGTGVVKQVEVPIVLLSTALRLKNSFQGDYTSHDLFDMHYLKDKVVEDPLPVRTQLIALVTGYQLITKSLRAAVPLRNILALDEKEFDALDPRIIHFFHDNSSTPVHEYARFVLKELILTPGQLICEDLLAARLGIDLKASSDWQELLDILGKARYVGAFHNAWPRWWSHHVERIWWRSLFPKIPIALSTLGARERVDVIKQKTGLKRLVPATPIRPHYTDHFQTVCEWNGHRPLDPKNSVMLSGKEPKPWQDYKYMAIDDALARKGADRGLQPHPLEEERIQVMREARRTRAES